MAQANLTAAFVKSVAEPGRYHDGQGTGLYLRVKASGAKSWVQRLMVNKRRVEIGLGPHPLVSLQDARKQAWDNKRKAFDGLDPLAEKQAEKRCMTFEQAARKVHELNKPSWRNPKHAAQFISTLETYTFPRLGQRPVGDVTPAEVLAVLTPIWHEKHETARRTYQRIGKVMKWAVAQGLRADNPADAISEALPKVKKTKAHRKALPYAKVPECLRDIQNSEAGISTRLALELLILTASRSNEVRLATWDQIEWDAEGGPIWHRPAEVMKSKVGHSVPLPPQAIAALERMPSVDTLKRSDGLIFTGTRRGKPLSDATLLKLVRSLGYDVDVHGFRTSFKTWAQERTNHPREVSEMALAHTIKDKAEAAYARSDLMEKRRKLMAAWGEFVVGEAGKVVRIG